MTSQRAADIDALIALAEPAAYVIPGESHAELAKQQVRDKHTCLRHILVAETSHNERTFTPLFSLQVGRCEWLHTDVADTALLLLSDSITGTLKLIPRTHADYSYNFSTSAQLCDINRNSVYLAVLPIAHNFQLACPGILGTLSCGGRGGSGTRR